MATKFKQIDKPKMDIAEKHDNILTVMKPFIKFGINATGLIANTLIQIVKSVPKPHHDKDDPKPGKRVIKL